MKKPLLNYTLAGSGKLVVFLHGFLENNSMWEAVTQLLPCKKLFIDLHGHGASFFDENLPCSVENMAQQVADVLAFEKLENPIIIIGHSMGGYVGLELFKKTQVKHLVLFHSHPWEDNLEKQKDRERVAKMVLSHKALFVNEAIPNLFYQKEKHIQIIEKNIQQACTMKAKAIAWSSLAMRNRTDNSNLLIEQPSTFTVIAGTEDKLIPFEAMQQFCAHNHVNLIAIKNTGHMSHVEKKDELANIFLELLSKNI